MTVMKLRYFLVFITAIVLFGFLFSQNLAWWSLNIVQKIGPERNISEILIKIAGTLNNKDAKLAFYTGLWYHKEHELEKAERFYKKSIELNPQIANAHYQLARVYFIESRFAAALSEINKELQVNPSNLRSYYIRGLVYGYSGQLKEAEADFKTFIASPLSSEINGWGGYNDLAWILMQEKKYLEAIKILQAAEKMFPKNVWIENGLGGTYMAIKDYSRAEKYYRVALDDSQKLTEKDWLLAYPAHDPKTAKDGINQIIKGIEKNLAFASKKFQ